jgi:nucleotide-binding universal stress UspA family protein
MSPFASVTLLATDGSREAEHAAWMAVELSRTLGSELHAAYVEPMPDPLAWHEVAILNPEDKALALALSMAVWFRESRRCGRLIRPRRL